MCVSMDWLHFTVRWDVARGRVRDAVQNGPHSREVGTEHVSMPGTGAKDAAEVDEEAHFQ